MKHFLRACLFETGVILGIGLIGISLPIQALPVSSSSFSQEQVKSLMIGDLDYVKHILEGHYAPLEWKKQEFGWDMNKAYADAKSEILNTNKMSIKHFHKVLRKFMGSMNDYHTHMTFISTESASLPFRVKGINGRYFVSWINKEALSPEYYNIQLGDELIEFDGKAPGDLIAELLQATGYPSTEETDRALAEMNLTLRLGAKGDDVPEGAIYVKFRSEAGNIYPYQLIWDHIPEMMHYPADLLNLFVKALPNSFEAHKKAKIGCRVKMMAPLHEAYAKQSPRLASLGSKKSIVPILGEIIWKPDNENLFSSYIYKNEEGRLIGYLRIPHYVMDLEDLKDFDEIIDYFQANTEGLVIDQIHNFGGYALYVYALASRLTDTPLVTPKHQFKINQWDILMAYNELEELSNVSSDEDAKEVFDEDFHPLPTLQYALFLKEFDQFFIHEWYQGKILTNPIHVEGVDYINPHPKHCYKKPILILIDELDFSGGDFFPAIMRDNKRAVLFGNRTSGAGGCVTQVLFPQQNQNGIFGFNYTISLATRSNQQCLENFGVSPDIKYQISIEDLRTHYQPYANAINQAMQNLLL